jgi:hypothetical protein
LNNKELQVIETITPEEAGKIIGKSPNWIRARLKEGNCNWGDCTQITPNQYNFIIFKNKFLEFVGINSSYDKDKVEKLILGVEMLLNSLNIA